MCGIAGFTGEDRPEVIAQMIRIVAPRGPDGSGVYSANCVHFGHTRLAILDREGGAQPMSRDDGNITVSYNGEIYNYDELKDDIERAGYRLTTKCDTELIPLGYLAFGKNFFGKLRGMFAFALHDRNRSKLYLVRDHLGIKPLFYSVIGSDIVFSSSARAVAKHPCVDRSLNPNALQEFLQYRYIKSNIHFFHGVEILRPGTYLEWSPNGISRGEFWLSKQRKSAGQGELISEDELIGRVSDTIETSVSRQLRSDVPLGIFLSGGVDSSLITHFAARHSRTQLTAFTFRIGDNKDEVEAAKKVAERYGLNHRTVELHSADFDHFPKAIACMDSPVGDAIVLPTYKLCEVASREVKVVLTGEGADELFGGYIHFPVLQRLGYLSERMPALSFLSPMIKHLPVHLLNLLFAYQGSLGKMGRLRVAEMIGAIGDTGRLAALANQVITDSELAEGTNLEPISQRLPEDLSLSAQMFEFTKTWLPNQILHKMDQLSMAHGLEARVPYVDPGLYDLLLRAPEKFFHRGRRDKVALRMASNRQKISASDRVKVPFNLPIEQLWPDEFKLLCDEWLSDEMILRHGIICRQFVRDCRKKTNSGEFLAAKKLVTLASLNIWLHANERL